MASSYPGALDALTNPTATDAMNSVTVPHATQHANANDAIEAIQGELGTDPAGAAATVKARLDTLDTTVGSKAPSASPTFTGTVTLPSTTSIGTVSSTEIGYLDGLTESLSTSLAGKASTEAFPHIVVIPGTTQVSAHNTTMTYIYLAASFYNCLTQTSGAIDRYMEYDVEVAAGTYTLRTLYRMSTTYGIINITVDGVTVGSAIDGYAAAATPNNINDVTGIALTAGRHTIRYAVASKNASSSNYFIALHGLSLTRTGA